MSDYKKILSTALNRLKQPVINEGLLYPEGMSEKIHPDLEQDLINKKTSLGNHPILPFNEDCSYEQKIMGERFADVVNTYKRNHDCDSIDNEKLLLGMMPMVHESMAIESNHRKALEKLAEKMIREEFDMDKDVVEIHAQLTPKINLIPEKLNKFPVDTEMTFKNHDEMKNAVEEIHKRRFLNAMTQGASKKCNHMFHMVDEELTRMDPRLPSRYAKMMSAADYMYYVIPNMEDGTTGGVVRVVFPTKENPKAQIHAQAMVFPVLIHELVKGVMELLSAHGLPKNKKLGKYVLNKADYLAAEPWDMRIGPALWGKFMEAIGADNFELKHHIYSEIAALPVHEFNHNMREILAGTSEGKKYIKTLVSEIKNDLVADEFKDAMGENEMFETEQSTESGFSFEDLGLGNENQGFSFESLFGGDDDDE